LNKSDAEVDVASAMGRSSKLKAPTGTDEDIEPSGKKSHARKAGQSGRQEGLGPPIQKSTRTYVIIFFGGSNKIPIV
jgi:hypothetical protein